MLNATKLFKKIKCYRHFFLKMARHPVGEDMKGR